MRRVYLEGASQTTHDGRKAGGHERGGLLGTGSLRGGGISGHCSTVPGLTLVLTLSPILSRGWTQCAPERSTGIEIAFTVFWAGRAGKVSEKSPDPRSEKVGPVFPPNVS